MNGFRINEKTDQMRRERIAHQQSNQQNSTRLISKFTPVVVNFEINLGVLDSRSRGPRPARTVLQAKEGEMLSTEELPRNQQFI